MYLPVADTHGLESGVLAGHFGANLVNDALALVLLAKAQQREGLEHASALVARMLLQDLIRLLEGLLVVPIVKSIWNTQQQKRHANILHNLVAGVIARARFVVPE